MKKQLLLICSIMTVLFVGIFVPASQFGKLKKENREILSQLRMVENERNALSDAIRCYADSKDTTIIEYSRWYLNAVGCPDSIGEWANIY